MNDYTEVNGDQLVLSDVEKLAVAQAFYKSVAEMVKTKTPTNLRGRVDEDMRAMFEDMKKLGTTPKSFDIELMGQKVGTYSITTTKPEESSSHVELDVEDEELLTKWALENGCWEVDMGMVRSMFELSGEVPDGCAPREVHVPGTPGGEIKSTSLRIDPEKVVSVLGPQLETVSYALLEGGE